MKYQVTAIMTCIPQATVYRIVQVKLHRKISQKWFPHELSEIQVEMRETYSIFILKNYNKLKICFQHIINIDETWMFFYRPTEKDQEENG